MAKKSAGTSSPAFYEAVFKGSPKAVRGLLTGLALGLEDEVSVWYHCDEDIASADYMTLLETVPALRGPVSELVGAEPTPGETASAIELVLEGLHHSSLLAREELVEGRVYKDMFQEMVRGLEGA